MFCKNCGSELADDALFCNQCGTAMQAEEVPSAEPAGEKPAMSERKLLGLIAWGLTAVVAIVMVISYFVAINTSIEDVPAISVFLDESDKEEFQAIGDEVKKDVEEIRELMDEVEEFSASDEEIINNALDALEKAGEDTSLINMKNLADSTMLLDEVEADDDNGTVVELLKISADEAGKEVSDILSLIMNIVLGFMLFALAFSVAGGLLRLKGLVISGLVLSVLYSLIFCGTVFVILVAVLNLALAIVAGRYRKA